MPTITVFRQDSQARVEPQHKTSYLVDSLETVKQVFDGETSAPRWFTPSPPWLNSDSGDDGWAPLQSTTCGCLSHVETIAISSSYLHISYLGKANNDLTVLPHWNHG